MRMSRAFLLAASLVASVSVSRAEDTPGPREIIARAIRSLGGPKRLARYHAQTWKEKAVYWGGGAAEPYEARYAAQWPDKFRVDVADDFTMVLNGQQGWVRSRGTTREMTRSELEEHREGTYDAWVMSVLPVLEKPFTLSPLGQRPVGGRPTMGVRVHHPGHRDVNLFFDRETGLLASGQTHFTEAKSGSEIDQEIIFSGYKSEPASGIQNPTKVSIQRNG